MHDIKKEQVSYSIKEIFHVYFYDHAPLLIGSSKMNNLLYHENVIYIFPFSMKTTSFFEMGFGIIFHNLFSIILIMIL